MRDAGRLDGPASIPLVGENRMLDTKEEVAETVKEAMRDAGLNRRAHIEFHPLLPDSFGMNDYTNGPVAWEEPPHWRIEFTYPADDGDATTREIQVNTADFQNLGEIKRYIANEISS